MIYLGDNWPAKYRNTYFVGNLHGNRINNDLLERQGSGYVARHGQDFLFGNNPWFRSLTQKYGPDGGVYISDWHDVGECHDNDGAHRSSGRIFKIVYGDAPPARKVDLSQSSAAELVAAQHHANDWMARHARRVLQERAEQGVSLVAEVDVLKSILSGEHDEVIRLRALWCLYSMNVLDSPSLQALLEDENEHMRLWAVRLLTDRAKPDDSIERALVLHARAEPSALVRLFLASAIQRVSAGCKWELAEVLMKYREDSGDANIPLMIWYGIEPLVSNDPDRAIELLKSSQIPLLRRNIARRLAES
jgi:hypothetical protein